MTNDTGGMLSRDAKYILRPWSGTPVPIVKAKGCWVTDESGRDYLDFTSGYFVNNAGHCHPRVNKAATNQLDCVTQVSGKQTTLPLIDLAERLVKLSPKSVDKVMFTTGGTEATEFALKMARQHTGKSDIAGLENAYHGLTLGSLALCANDNYRATAGVPLGDYTYRIPTAYCYRCKFSSNCHTQCLDEAETKIDARPHTAAVIAEPVQAVGGLIPPQGWWSRLDEIRKKRGLLLILDEIQTGVGRTGKMFAAEHYGLEPDIITGGKGLSGGIGSLGVVLVKGRVAAEFAAGTTPTSGGNAVSAAAGVALIDTILDDNLLENATAMSDHMRRAIADLDDPWIGDIRFKGLLGGVELVSDRESKEILAKKHVAAIHRSMHDQGIMLTVSGPHSNVLRLQPPLTISVKEVDIMVRALRSALQSTREASHCP